MHNCSLQMTRSRLACTTAISKSNVLCPGAGVARLPWAHLGFRGPKAKDPGLGTPKAWFGECSCAGKLGTCDLKNAVVQANCEAPRLTRLGIQNWLAQLRSSNHTFQVCLRLRNCIHQTNNMSPGAWGTGTWARGPGPGAGTQGPGPGPWARGRSLGM